MAVTILKHAQIGDIPRTPLTPYSDQREIRQACNLLEKYALHYGMPTAYKQEQNGQLIHSIVPNPNTENDQISSSSKVDLQLHTETAFHPFKPSHVILMCLRGDENAQTTYALAEDIASKLDEQTLSALMEPNFITRIDDSFRTHGESDREFRKQIFSRLPNGELSICFDEFFMRADESVEGAAEALEKLKSVIPECVKEVTLDTGDVMIMDNRKVIHGRKSFIPRYDGTDRWLLRILVSQNLPPRGQYIHFDHITVTTDL